MPGSAAWDLPSHPSSRDGHENPRDTRTEHLGKEFAGAEEEPLPKVQGRAQAAALRTAHPPAEHDFIRFQRFGHFLHDIANMLLQAAFADIVFVGALFVGQVAEFHGFDGSTSTTSAVPSPVPRPRKSIFPLRWLPRAYIAAAFMIFTEQASALRKRRSNPALPQVARIDDRAVV